MTRTVKRNRRWVLALLLRLHDVGAGSHDRGDGFASGGVPVATAAKAKIASSADKDFLTFVFDSVNAAPNFQQSWDQALSATQSEAMLNNISQLFSKQIGPEQFASAMNATIGK